MKKLTISIFVFTLSFVTTTFAQQALSTSQNKLPDQQQSFKVVKSLLNVTDTNLLAILKNNQSSSLISEGKIVNINTFLEEKNRIYKLLSPAQLQLKMKDIVFNVDTTLQKSLCTVVTFVRSEI